MTYIVSSGALNSTHSLTYINVADIAKYSPACDSYNGTCAYERLVLRPHFASVCRPTMCQALTHYWRNRYSNSHFKVPWPFFSYLFSQLICQPEPLKRKKIVPMYTSQKWRLTPLGGEIQNGRHRQINWEKNIVVPYELYELYDWGKSFVTLRNFITRLMERTTMETGRIRMVTEP